MCRPIRFAINGFGRIGRAVARQWVEQQAEGFGFVAFLIQPQQGFVSDGVVVEALEAAAAYEAAWAARSPAQAFDLCVLGLGDDSHIASLWPQCPLIGRASGPRFVATEWPGRGWRLTITELDTTSFNDRGLGVKIP